MGLDCCGFLPAVTGWFGMRQAVPGAERVMGAARAVAGGFDRHPLLLILGPEGKARREWHAGSGCPVVSVGTVSRRVFPAAPGGLREGRRSPPQEDTCWYLSQLLDRFGRSEGFFSWEAGRYGLRPLALLYGDATEARGIRQDYFIGMGGGAYDYLVENARHGRHVFAELSAAFASMLELVAQACASDAAQSNEDILTLYEKWLETRSPLLERQLRALGVKPEPMFTLQ